MNQQHSGMNGTERTRGTRNKRQSNLVSPAQMAQAYQYRTSQNVDFNDSMHISNDNTTDSQQIMQNKSMYSVVNESIDFIKKQKEIEEMRKK